MNKLVLFTALISIAATAPPATAAGLSFASQAQRTTLIELYTSEGCSSCPPAEHWLSGLKNDAHLWKQFVPVAFHVDYWDYLGWRDRFSEARFSRRQADYERRGYLQTVYTPGVMKNGREWRGWYRSEIPSSVGPEKVGILKASLIERKLSVQFVPQRQYQTSLLLHMALLGFNLSTRVEAGENSGKLLKHDFTVMDFRQFKQTEENGRFRWEVDMPPVQTPPATAGLALWVTLPQDPTPIQATGSWLK